MNKNISLHQGAKLSQQLNLAPQLLNWLKLLQVSTVDLEAAVQQELISNPALEVESPDNAEDAQNEMESSYEEDAELYLDKQDVGERLGALADIDEEWRTADEPQLTANHVLQEKHDYMMNRVAEGSGLGREVEQAIRLSELSDDEKRVAQVLTGMLDARGYLEAALEDIAQITGESEALVESVIEAFQQLVPAGVGARNLRECLMLQLRAMDRDTALAERLVSNFLDHVASGRNELLADHLGVDLVEVEDAVKLIRTLDPEPGAEKEADTAAYVEADLEIYCVNGELQIRLLDERLPRLQLSSYCRRLLEAKKGSPADLEYIRARIREADFLIKGISQRQDTMLRVANEIIRVQREFLSTRDGALEPLTMNKVASIMGVHETTVSRAVANKYIRTDRGVFEMRSFFKVGYQCADGSACTPERVKSQLQVFVSREEPEHPLTDAQLSDQFKKMGLKVARRTIAKYREETGIPSSKERLAAARRRAALQEAI